MLLTIVGGQVGLQFLTAYDATTLRYHVVAPSAVPRGIAAWPREREESCLVRGVLFFFAWWIVTTLSLEPQSERGLKCRS